MILFPSCKINLGLNVLRRRDDGYHDIESVMYPVRGLSDVVEIIANGTDGVRFSSSGMGLDCPPDDNICVRAWKLMRERCAAEGVDIHLHKAIPFGAGLGGGSADGVAVIKILDELFHAGLDTPQLEFLAGELGSDTVFFVRDTPALVEGRGEKLTPSAADLDGYYITIVKPDIFVSTKEAYAGVTPSIPSRRIEEVLRDDITTWRENLRNDFEESVFALHPEIARIKETLYDAGALYASMSGSGSAVYGIFREEPRMEFKDMFTYTGKF